MTDVPRGRHTDGDVLGPLVAAARQAFERFGVARPHGRYRYCLGIPTIFATCPEEGPVTDVKYGVAPVQFPPAQAHRQAVPAHD